VVSEPVIVFVPAVFNVTLNTCDPATNAPLLGSPAFTSLEVIPTTSFVLIKFQLASTAFTVTVKPLPAVCATGVPVFPVSVPAAADSPGTSNCTLANAPALTVIAGLVLAVLPPSVMSLAVNVQLPAVRFVTLNTLAPDASAAFPGSISFGSVEVIPTVSPALPTTFQNVSTAFTVTA